MAVDQLGPAEMIDQAIGGGELAAQHRLAFARAAASRRRCRSAAGPARYACPWAIPPRPKLRPARYDRATGEETTMAEKPETRHHAPAEDGAGLLGKRRPDGRGRARGLHRDRPRPRHHPGGRQGRRHQRAQCRAAADGAHRHDPARRARAMRFANAPDVQRFLVKDGERYAGPWILFTKPRWTAFGELSRAPAQHDGEPGSASTPSSPSTTRGATTPPPTRSAWARPACSAAASTSAAAS